MNIRSTVLDRYSQGAQEREESLCCPVGYDPSLLEILPDEIIERDYGCGDPSRYVEAGDCVLDLGSGGGKICYMAAQLVGEQGRVIGVDMNDDMLALARRHQASMAERLGGDRVCFHKGFIQDLALDVEAMEAYLAEHPVRTAADYQRLHDWQARQRAVSPLIGDASVDLVISNCVLNLVHDSEKAAMIHEIFRVLKPGGRVAISDIVSDEPIPDHLKADPELWSGCISGAFEEAAFIAAFAEAGFVGIAIDKWDATPWQVVEGIEFRSVTLTAVRPDDRPCIDQGHAAISRRRCSAVSDDEGHVFPRGERMAICERTYELLSKEPYRGHFITLAPSDPGEGRAWCAPSGTRRPAAETKTAHHAGGHCGPGSACC